MNKKRVNPLLNKDNDIDFFVKADDTHTRREKAKARDLRQSQWWKNICARSECYYCKKRTAPQDLTMDHIVPIIRGGRTTRKNVIPACKECNTKKSYLLPIEWQEYLENL